MTALVLFVCTVFAAAFIQGTAGFGFMFFALPLAGLVFDFKVAVVALGLLAQVLNLVILAQHRFRADWRSVGVLAASAVPGVPVGVWALKSLPVPWLQGVLGALLVTFALYQWMVRPVPRGLGRPWMVGAGVMAGALGGAMFTQGPPVLVFVSLQPWDKDRVKGTLVAFFTVTGFVILPYQAASGLVTGEVLRLAAWGLPLLLAGVLCGRWLYLRLGDGEYRKVFMILVFVLGLLLLAKSTGVV